MVSSLLSITLLPLIVLAESSYAQAFPKEFFGNTPQVEQEKSTQLARLDAIGQTVQIRGEDEEGRFLAAQEGGGADGVAGGIAGGPPPDKSGTDPRDFAPKFMPYYRYTTLENDLEVNEFTLFGLQDFHIGDKHLAVTYELPTIKDVDWDSSDSGLPSSISETGVGDLVLRVFAPLGKEKKIRNELAVRCSIHDSHPYR